MDAMQAMDMNKFIIIAGLVSFILSVISEQYVTYIALNIIIMYGSTSIFEKIKLKKGLAR